MRFYIRITIEEVIDPEIGLNVSDLNMIRDVNIGDEDIELKIILTTPFCPLAGFIVDEVKMKTMEVAEGREVDVEVLESDMIELKNLTVSVEDKRVLNDVNLHIVQGETIVLLGPNGSGKTSLLKTIIGIPGYKVESGRILFSGKDITGLTIDERARLGIGIAFQRPPAVRGVKLKDMLRICMEKRGDFKEEKINEFAQKLNLLNCLDRDINLGFSGGEIKRSELLQLLAQDPRFIMLDEPDSGVDLVNINLVGRVINELLEKEKMASKRTKAGLIITHAGYILDYVNADRGCIMLNGTVFCSGNPRDLLEDIRTKGYEGCVRCLK